MEQDMVQDGAKAIDCLLIPLRVFEALGHRDAERARMVRSLRKQRPAHARFRTRRRVNCGPVELHELSPLDLPIMYGSNPVDRRLKFREARRVSKGGPHCPAPVSVVSRSYPSCFAYQAWARAVFTLWLPVGL